MATLSTIYQSIQAAGTFTFDTTLFGDDRIPTLINEQFNTDALSATFTSGREENDQIKIEATAQGKIVGIESLPIQIRIYESAINASTSQLECEITADLPNDWNLYKGLDQFPEYDLVSSGSELLSRDLFLKSYPVTDCQLYFNSKTVDDHPFGTTSIETISGLNILGYFRFQGALEYAGTFIGKSGQDKIPFSAYVDTSENANYLYIDTALNTQFTIAEKLRFKLDWFTFYTDVNNPYLKSGSGFLFTGNIFGIDTSIKYIPSVDNLLIQIDEEYSVNKILMSLSALMNGANIRSFLPENVPFGDVKLKNLSIDFSLQTKQINVLNFTVVSDSTWEIIPGMISVKDLVFEWMLMPPFTTDKVSFTLYGTVKVGDTDFNVRSMYPGFNTSIELGIGQTVNFTDIINQFYPAGASALPQFIARDFEVEVDPTQKSFEGSIDIGSNWDINIGFGSLLLNNIHLDLNYLSAEVTGSVSANLSINNIDFYISAAKTAEGWAFKGDLNTDDPIDLKALTTGLINNDSYFPDVSLFDGVEKFELSDVSFQYSYAQEQKQMALSAFGAVRWDVFQNDELVIELNQVQLNIAQQGTNAAQVDGKIVGSIDVGPLKGVQVSVEKTGNDWTLSTQLPENATLNVQGIISSLFGSSSTEVQNLSGGLGEINLGGAQINFTFSTDTTTSAKKIDFIPPAGTTNWNIPLGKSSISVGDLSFSALSSTTNSVTTNTYQVHGKVNLLGHIVEITYDSAQADFILETEFPVSLNLNEIAGRFADAGLLSDLDIPNVDAFIGFEKPLLVLNITQKAIYVSENKEGANAKTIVVKEENGKWQIALASELVKGNDAWNTKEIVPAIDMEVKNAGIAVSTFQQFDVKTILSADQKASLGNQPLQSGLNFYGSLILANSGWTKVPYEFVGGNPIHLYGLITKQKKEFRASVDQITFPEAWMNNLVTLTNTSIVVRENNGSREVLLDTNIRMNLGSGLDFKGSLLLGNPPKASFTSQNELEVPILDVELDNLMFTYSKTSFGFGGQVEYGKPTDEDYLKAEAYVQYNNGTYEVLYFDINKLSVKQVFEIAFKVPLDLPIYFHDITFAFNKTLNPIHLDFEPPVDLPSGLIIDGDVDLFGWDGSVNAEFLLNEKRADGQFEFEPIEIGEALTISGNVNDENAHIKGAFDISTTKADLEFQGGISVLGLAKFGTKVILGRSGLDFTINIDQSFGISTDLVSFNSAVKFDLNTKIGSNLDFRAAGGGSIGLGFELGPIEAFGQQILPKITLDTSLSGHLGIEFSPHRFSVALRDASFSFKINGIGIDIDLPDFVIDNKGLSTTKIPTIAELPGLVGDYIVENAATIFRDALLNPAFYLQLTVQILKAIGEAIISVIKGLWNAIFGGGKKTPSYLTESNKGLSGIFSDLIPDIDLSLETDGIELEYKIKHQGLNNNSLTEDAGGNITQLIEAATFAGKTALEIAQNTLSYTDNNQLADTLQNITDKRSDTDLFDLWKQANRNKTDQGQLLKEHFGYSALKNLETVYPEKSTVDIEVVHWIYALGYDQREIANVFRDKNVDIVQLTNFYSQTQQFTLAELIHLFRAIFEKSAVDTTRALKASPLSITDQQQLVSNLLDGGYTIDEIGLALVQEIAPDVNQVITLLIAVNKGITLAQIGKTIKLYYPENGVQRTANNVLELLKDQQSWTAKAAYEQLLLMEYSEMEAVNGVRRHFFFDTNANEYNKTLFQVITDELQISDPKKILTLLKTSGEGYESALTQVYAKFNPTLEEAILYAFEQYELRSESTIWKLLNDHYHLLNSDQDAEQKYVLIHRSVQQVFERREVTQAMYQAQIPAASMAKVLAQELQLTSVDQLIPLAQDVGVDGTYLGQLFKHNSFSISNDAIVDKMQLAGYNITDQANALLTVQATAQQACTYFQSYFTAHEVVPVLRSTFSLTDDLVIAQHLFSANYPIADIAQALNKNTFLLEAQALKAIGYTAKQVGDYIEDTYYLDTRKVTQTLKDIGYTLEEIIPYLKSKGTSTAIVKSALQTAIAAGFAKDIVVSNINSFLPASKAQQACTLLHDLGISVTQLQSILTNTYNKSGDTVVSILKNAGVNAVDLDTVMNASKSNVQEKLESLSISPRWMIEVMRLTKYDLDDDDILDKLIASNKNYALQRLAELMRVTLNGGMSLDAAATYFKSNSKQANESAQALQYGYDIDDAETLALALKQAGYSAAEIIDAIKGTMKKTKVEAIYKILYLAGFNATETLQGLVDKNVEKDKPKAIERLLWLEYSNIETGRALKAVWNVGNGDIVKHYKEAKQISRKAGEVLKEVYGVDAHLATKLIRTGINNVKDSDLPAEGNRALEVYNVMDATLVLSETYKDALSYSAGTRTTQDDQGNDQIEEILYSDMYSVGECLIDAKYNTEHIIELFQEVFDFDLGEENDIIRLLKIFKYAGKTAKQIKEDIIYDEDVLDQNNETEKSGVKVSGIQKAAILLYKTGFSVLEIGQTAYEEVQDINNTATILQRAGFDSEELQTGIIQYDIAKYIKSATNHSPQKTADHLYQLGFKASYTKNALATLFNKPTANIIGFMSAQKDGAKSYSPAEVLSAFTMISAEINLDSILSLFKSKNANAVDVAIALKPTSTYNIAEVSASYIQKYVQAGYDPSDIALVISSVYEIENLLTYTKLLKDAGYAATNTVSSAKVSFGEFEAPLRLVKPLYTNGFNYLEIGQLMKDQLKVDKVTDDQNQHKTAYYILTRAEFTCAEIVEILHSVYGYSIDQVIQLLHGDYTLAMLVSAVKTTFAVNDITALGSAFYGASVDGKKPYKATDIAEQLMAYATIDIGILNNIGLSLDEMGEVMKTPLSFSMNKAIEQLFSINKTPAEIAHVTKDIYLEKVASTALDEVIANGQTDMATLITFIKPVYFGQPRDIIDVLSSKGKPVQEIVKYLKDDGTITDASAVTKALHTLTVSSEVALRILIDTSTFSKSRTDAIQLLQDAEYTAEEIADALKKVWPDEMTIALLTQLLVQFNYETLPISRALKTQFPDLTVTQMVQHLSQSNISDWSAIEAGKVAYHTYEANLINTATILKDIFTKSEVLTSIQQVFDLQESKAAATPLATIIQSELIAWATAIKETYGIHDHYQVTGTYVRPPYTHLEVSQILKNVYELEEEDAIRFLYGQGYTGTELVDVLKHHYGKSDLLKVINALHKIGLPLSELGYLTRYVIKTSEGTHFEDGFSVLFLLQLTNLTPEEYGQIIKDTYNIDLQNAKKNYRNVIRFEHTARIFKNVYGQSAEQMIEYVNTQGLQGSARYRAIGMVIKPLYQMDMKTLTPLIEAQGIDSYHFSLDISHQIVNDLFQKGYSAEEVAFYLKYVDKFENRPLITTTYGVFSVTKTWVDQGTTKADVNTGELLYDLNFEVPDLIEFFQETAHFTIDEAALILYQGGFDAYTSAQVLKAYATDVSEAYDAMRSGGFDIIDIAQALFTAYSYHDVNIAAAFYTSKSVGAVNFLSILKEVYSIELAQSGTYLKQHNYSLVDARIAIKEVYQVTDATAIDDLLKSAGYITELATPTTFKVQMISIDENQVVARDQWSIDWPEVPHASSYEVIIKNTTDDQLIRNSTDVNASALRLEYNELIVGKAHEVKIRGIKDGVIGDWYEDSFALSPLAAPTMEWHYDDQIVLHWPNVDTAFDYSVEIYEDDGESLIRQINNIQNTTVSIANVPINREYQLRIRTNTEHVIGHWGEKFIIRIFPLSTTSYAIEKADNQWLFTWRATGPAEDYDLKLTNLQHQTDTIFEKGLTSNQYTCALNQLLEGTEYRLQIRSNKQLTKGTWINETFTLSVPPAPEITSWNYDIDNGLFVDWEDSASNNARFEMFITHKSGPYSGPPIPPIDRAVSEYSMTPAGFQEGNTYSFKIRENTNVVKGLWTTEIEFEVKVVTPIEYVKKHFDQGDNINTTITKTDQKFPSIQIDVLVEALIKAGYSLDDTVQVVQQRIGSESDANFQHAFQRVYDFIAPTQFVQRHYQDWGAQDTASVLFETYVNLGLSEFIHALDEGGFTAKEIAEAVNTNYNTLTDVQFKDALDDYFLFKTSRQFAFESRQQGKTASETGGLLKTNYPALKAYEWVLTLAESGYNFEAIAIALVDNYPSLTKDQQLEVLSHTSQQVTIVDELKAINTAEIATVIAFIHQRIDPLGIDFSSLVRYLALAEYSFEKVANIVQTYQPAISDTSYQVALENVGTFKSLAQCYDQWSKEEITAETFKDTVTNNFPNMTPDQVMYIMGNQLEATEIAELLHVLFPALSESELHQMLFALYKSNTLTSKVKALHEQGATLPQLVEYIRQSYGAISDEMLFKTLYITSLPLEEIMSVFDASVAMQLLKSVHDLTTLVENVKAAKDKGITIEEIVQHLEENYQVPHRSMISALMLNGYSIEAITATLFTDKEIDFNAFTVAYDHLTLEQHATHKNGDTSEEALDSIIHYVEVVNPAYLLSTLILHGFDPVDIQPKFIAKFPEFTATKFNELLQNEPLLFYIKIRELKDHRAHDISALQALKNLSENYKGAEIIYASLLIEAGYAMHEIVEALQVMYPHHSREALEVLFFKKYHNQTLFEKVDELHGTGMDAKAAFEALRTLRPSAADAILLQYLTYKYTIEEITVAIEALWPNSADADFHRNVPGIFYTLSQFTDHHQGSQVDIQAMISLLNSYSTGISVKEWIGALLDTGYDLDDIVPQVYVNFPGTSQDDVLNILRTFIQFEDPKTTLKDAFDGNKTASEALGEIIGFYRTLLPADAFTMLMNAGYTEEQSKGALRTRYPDLSEQEIQNIAGAHAPVGQ